jgi:hypothetical protein
MHKPSKIQRKIHRRFFRYAVAMLSVPLAIVAATIWTIAGSGPDQRDGDQVTRHTAKHVTSATSEAAPSWGREALNAVYRGVAESSPIQLANACGAGASSCFKCHDGKRASAPKYDEQTGPWHLHHKTVDHSCVGCHKGNERIIKKEIAHVALIVDPRTKSEACTGCHKPEEVAMLLPRYKKIAKP